LKGNRYKTRSRVS